MVHNGGLIVLKKYNILMKTVFALVLCLMVNHQLRAQGIKKIKIEELTDYIDKSDHPLIVNFWATYCLPCIHEIPYFQAETKKYEKKGVELLLVSLDLSDYYPLKIAAFVNKQQYVATLFWLDESNADHFCPKIDKNWSGGIPSTLFVNNKTGYRRFFERQLTEPQLKENIFDLLK
jgi:thiol-disulfide isomerase/thioredoxin